MAELHDLSATEQGAAIRAGELDPVELTEHYLRRIEAHSDTVGAFITVTADLALRQAHAARERVRAAAGDEVLPPTLGVCVPVKDLSAVDGVRMTMGSAAFADFIPRLDAHVVTKLKAAGAVITGKTTTPELGLPCYTEPDVAPPARTPWNLQYSAGGSSGGAAAAVASGLAPIALGSDGGGSIRIPAALCALVGFKPSRGRVSFGPMGVDPAGLVCEGPLARTVADAALLLDTVCGPMPGDATWAPPPPHSFVRAAASDPPRLRIGRFATGVIARPEIDRECLAAYEDATTLLLDLGHDVVEITGPSAQQLAPTFRSIWATLAASLPLTPPAELQLRPLTRWLRAQAHELSATDFVSALARMQAFARDTLRSWACYDAILSPTLAAVCIGVGELRNDADPAADFAAQADFTPFTSLYNITGQPAISLPLGWSSDGMPVGVMLAGRPAGDGELLSLAGQLERAAPWYHRRPAPW